MTQRSTQLKYAFALNFRLTKGMYIYLVNISYIRPLAILDQRQISILQNSFKHPCIWILFFFQSAFFSVRLTVK